MAPVQTFVLGLDANGVDLMLVSAQSGSGKTVAFGLTITLTLLDSCEGFDRAAAPSVMIIAPTRELSIQVRREFEWFYAASSAPREAGCCRCYARRVM